MATADPFARLRDYPLSGRMLREEIMPAGGQTAVVMSPGQVLRFVDVSGKQVVDIVCFNRFDLAEYLHLANSINLNGHLEFRIGDGLYSVTCNKMLSIAACSNDRSFAFGSMCSEELNRIRYGTANTKNCRDNLAAALNPWGIDRRAIPNAFVPFMNVKIGPDMRLEIVEPTTQPGDFYDLRAEMALVVGVSNCPQENNPCNGFTPTEMGLIVYEPSLGEH